jgi:uncharacterized protein YndB with AHSA1/START domain
LFEASHSERVRAPAEAVWELWADPARWPEWDRRIERAEADGELAVGSEVRVKMRKGGTVHHRVTEFADGRRLVTGARFPGAWLGHEHRLEPDAGGSRITHSITVAGPLWLPWALMLGRGRLRKAVVGFVEREHELIEPGAGSV